MHVKFMKTNLINKQKQNPVYYTVLVLLLTIAFSAIPSFAQFVKGNLAFVWTTCVLRGFILFFPFCLVIFFNKDNYFKFNNFFIKNILICIPFFIVCLNNFPFISLIFKGVKLKFDSSAIPYVFICLFISIFEEIIFRGIIVDFSSNFYKIGNNVFLRIIVCSLIFAICHLVNVISLSPLYMLMQLGYSFLIGAMCVLCRFITGNLIVPIILHFVYDFGGILSDFGYVSGNIWVWQSVVFTAVLSVLVCVYAIIVFIKWRKKIENGNSKS